MNIRGKMAYFFLPRLRARLQGTKSFLNLDWETDLQNIAQNPSNTVGIIKKACTNEAEFIAQKHVFETLWCHIKCEA